MTNTSNRTECCVSMLYIVAMYGQSALRANVGWKDYCRFYHKSFLGSQKSIMHSL